MYDDILHRVRVINPGRRDLCGRYAFQTLVWAKESHEYYLVSTVNIPAPSADYDPETGFFPIDGSRMETLVFHCDDQGNTGGDTSIGGYFVTQEEAMNMLADKLREKPCPTCGHKEDI